MLEKRIYVYAIDKATYDITDSHYLKDGWISIRNILLEAKLMHEKYQDSAYIMIADGTREIADQVRTVKNTGLMEDKVILKELIEQNGFQMVG